MLKLPTRKEEPKTASPQVTNTETSTNQATLVQTTAPLPKLKIKLKDIVKTEEAPSISEKIAQATVDINELADGESKKRKNIESETPHSIEKKQKAETKLQESATSTPQSSLPNSPGPMSTSLETPATPQGIRCKNFSLRKLTQ